MGKSMGDYGQKMGLTWVARKPPKQFLYFGGSVEHILFRYFLNIFFILKKYIKLIFKIYFFYNFKKIKII
jgi:hypothetical protein